MSCSNKERGCAWEGELGQLDQHINFNPDKEKRLVGCAYTSVLCEFCEKPFPRRKVEQHQTTLCPKRPFTCFMCEDYKSTCEDVVNSHAPVCKNADLWSVPTRVELKTCCTNPWKSTCFASVL